MQEPHPSRSAPKCVDCRHYQHHHRFALCDHPANGVSQVTGLSNVTAERCRQSSAFCGQAAAWFEALRAQKPAEAPGQLDATS